MIVPAMSKDEIIKEMLHDFDIVRRKSVYILKDVQKQLIKSKKYPFVQAYDYVTPKTKNNWIYILEFQNKKDIFQTFVNYHYTSIGLMAGLVTNDMEITFYTGHFFSRFVEREGLNISNPIDKIKEFFKLNPILGSEVQEELEGGAREFIGRVKTGVVLGIQSKKNILVCNTYLSNEMLRKDQALITNSLNAELDNYQRMVDERLI